MAEHQIEDNIIGLALDGTGYGEDGNIWGGEILICNLNSFRRVAHFDYLPMPGGDRAIHEPWRMAVSYLRKYVKNGTELANSLFKDRTGQIKIISQAMDKNINVPLTSSCGRLFDAIAAILGIRETVAYEGQAAIILEALAGEASGDIPDLGEFALIKNTDQYLIDPTEIFSNIVSLRMKGRDISGISRAFHEALINIFTQIACLLRSETGLKQIALSGGCFQNMLILNGLSQKLRKNAFQVFTNVEVPVNDGGISLGQAYWGMHN